MTLDFARMTALPEVAVHVHHPVHSAGADEPARTSCSITTTAIRTVPHRVTLMQQRFATQRTTPVIN
jgi:hypothetical protein